MGIRVKVKTTGKSFARIKANIEKLDKQRSEVGYFQQQGVHTSGYTFPVIMAIHEFGIGVTPRPVFTIAGQLMLNPRKTSYITKSFKKWSITSSSTAVGIRTMLDEIGEGTQGVVAPLFGNASVLPVTLNPTPLIDTSELLANLARKDTLNNTVRRV